MSWLDVPGDKLLEPSVDIVRSCLRRNLPYLLSWAFERFFPWGANVDFFRSWLKAFFQGGPTMMKFHFANSKPTEKYLSTKNDEYENIKFQNLRGPSRPLLPSSCAHACCGKKQTGASYFSVAVCTLRNVCTSVEANFRDVDMNSNGELFDVKFSKRFMRYCQRTIACAILIRSSVGRIKQKSICIKPACSVQQTKPGLACVGREIGSG